MQTSGQQLSENKVQSGGWTILTHGSVFAVLGIGLVLLLFLVAFWISRRKEETLDVESAVEVDSSVGSPTAQSLSLKTAFPELKPAFESIHSSSCNRSSSDRTD